MSVLKWQNFHMTVISHIDDSLCLKFENNKNYSCYYVVNLDSTDLKKVFTGEKKVYLASICTNLKYLKIPTLVHYKSSPVVAEGYYRLQEDSLSKCNIKDSKKLEDVLFEVEQMR